MCDISSRVDAINNNKSIVRFRWFAIILQDYFLQLPSSLKASLVAFNAKIHTSRG